MTEKFDETYFERGVEARVSGYENYHWRPEYVLPLANWLKNRFHKVTYLDYGCAKGFLVKALRLLDCEAYGYDISTYAVENAEPDVKVHLLNYWMVNKYDVIICKDVLEHINKDKLYELIDKFYKVSEYVVVIVPLGDNGKFRIREYELDVTHVTKEDEVFWINLFNEHNFVCEEFYYSIDGIKDNWTKNFPYGNGIFIFKRK